MNSLSEIKAVLGSALGSQALFELVSTRVMLNTGVSLGDFPATQDSHPESVSKVLSALTSMGYSQESLTLVANRKKS